MPRTTACRRGDVVLIRFPFTDLRGAKQRPALVLSDEGYHGAGTDVIVAAISSRRGESPGPFDHRIKRWRECGLLAPSVVRAGKLVTLNRSLVRRTLGSLSPGDLEEVDRRVRRALGPG